AAEFIPVEDGGRKARRSSAPQTITGRMPALKGKSPWSAGRPCLRYGWTRPLAPRDPAMRRAALLLASLALLSGPAGAWAAPEGYDQAADEKLLRDRKVATDGPGLLEFFRKRTPTEELRKQVEALVGKLASRTYRERERASAALVAVGP